MARSVFFWRLVAPISYIPQILMRDTRSSNGTWINGTRLSAKGEKSERFGLQSHDILVGSTNNMADVQVFILRF